MKAYDVVPGLEFDPERDFEQSPAWFLDGTHSWINTVHLVDGEISGESGTLDFRTGLELYGPELWKRAPLYIAGAGGLERISLDKVDNSINRPLISGGIGQRIGLGEGERPGITQQSIPGLGDHRQRPAAVGGGAVLLHHPRDERLVHRTDAVGVGDHHRAVELAGLFEPGRACHLAVAV